MRDDSEFLNPSIGTFLNDQTANNLKQLFFNKPLLSDISFELDDGTVVYAHKVGFKIRMAGRRRRRKKKMMMMQNKEWKRQVTRLAELRC